ncbi:MAG TPA: 1-deoxy-D-xylulose-5-phosphate synthase [Spirochaetota bacterium]|nr:1-deoxy-D-xylulose-5-phosphate synthase [Spirochaetota bacterium]
MILEKINSPADLKKLSVEEMTLLSEEVRGYMLDVISVNGGHLASSLGVVELTLALHHVFNTPVDKIIWDVGHQAYAHKIVTGRREDFRAIRRKGGISGFPKRSESPYDPYDVGHSSTSISLAVGEAVGRDLAGKNYKVVAVIGDGSLTGGMAFEALNHIGHIGNDVIIILNDNEHSISQNVGAISTYLTEMISGSFYNRFRKKSMEVVQSIPVVGDFIYRFIYRIISTTKGFLIPGQLFENLGIRYFGPVDGHNIAKLVDILDRVKRINSGPKIVHVLTKKGKGFQPAEFDPCTFHGTGPFERCTGERSLKASGENYSSVAGRTLAAIAKKDRSVVAVTAAMKEGTGLAEFEKVAPKRIFDVGIAEQHAVTFSAALASTGARPFIAIYSTFMQRALDQVIHDTALMNLPVRFLIDRAGIVGEDGETHHGLFDISMIRNIPNFQFFAPSNGAELRDMIYYAWKHDSGPVAIRYPRGTAASERLDVSAHGEFVPGKIKVLSRGTDLAILAAGDMVQNASELAALLKQHNISSTVVNVLSIKPLDVKGIERVINGCRKFITIENAFVSGGLGEYIYSHIDPALCVKKIVLAGFPDCFITHGTSSELFDDYGLNAEKLAGIILPYFSKAKKAVKTKKRLTEK